MDFVEKDMYEPVKNYMNAQGCELKVEGKGCVIAGHLDGTLGVVAL